jgi:hypothetical protein
MKGPSGMAACSVSLYASIVQVSPVLRRQFYPVLTDSAAATRSTYGKHYSSPRAAASLLETEGKVVYAPTGKSAHENNTRLPVLSSDLHSLQRSHGTNQKPILTFLSSTSRRERGRSAGHQTAEREHHVGRWLAKESSAAV